ncbi:hypothetical protein AB0L59_26135 [Streptomyces sp. NPDC052109]|uniref:hypothetical protein n=1 Tax=Streptomyces sp. NPDC052109 TaxID=3155527 RepID=UPI00343BDB39
MSAEGAGGAEWREPGGNRIIAPLGLRHTYIPGEIPCPVGPHERVTIDGPGGEPVASGAGTDSGCTSCP